MTAVTVNTDLAATAYTPVYTCSAGKRAQANLMILNRSNDLPEVRLAIVANGGNANPPDAANFVEYDLKLGLKGSDSARLERTNITLAEGDQIIAYSNISGVNITCQALEENLIASTTKLFQVTDLTATGGNTTVLDPISQNQAAIHITICNRNSSNAAISLAHANGTQTDADWIYFEHRLKARGNSSAVIEIPSHLLSNGDELIASTDTDNISIVCRGFTN